MAIHLVYCATRKNGKIIGIGTEDTAPLGGKYKRYWTAKEVYLNQNKEEFELLGDKSITKGICDFEIQSKDGSRIVSIEAIENGNEYHIPKLLLGDNDLLENLPECTLKNFYLSTIIHVKIPEELVKEGDDKYYPVEVISIPLDKLFELKKDDKLTLDEVKVPNIGPDIIKRSYYVIDKKETYPNGNLAVELFLEDAY